MQAATHTEKMTISTMLAELQDNCLSVVLIPAPDPQHVGHMIRATEQHNAPWYREFCERYSYPRTGYDRPKTIIKRQATIKALCRILDDDDCTTVYAERLLNYARNHTTTGEIHMNYHAKKTSTSNLAHAFLQNGWELRGYKEDQSDMMTDYYSPAYWHGTATHPNYPGYIIVCDCSPYNQKSDSGQDVFKTKQQNTGACPTCNGSGDDPSGWTLTAARANPLSFNNYLIEQEHGDNAPNIQNLMPNIVSPAPFDGETLKCQNCHGLGSLTESVKEYAYTWPVFLANKKGMMWHIENDEEIIKSGKGYKRLDVFDRENAEGLALYGEIVAHLPEPTEPTDDTPHLTDYADDDDSGTSEELIPATGYNAPLFLSLPAYEFDQEPAAVETETVLQLEPAAVDDPQPELNVTHDNMAYEIKTERDWTWLHFDDKPSATVRKTLKKMFGARFSGKRKAWYITHELDAAQLIAAL